MNYREGFRQYLIGTYTSKKTGRALSVGTASDVLTRCSRVERALNIDLDAELSSSGGLVTVQESIKHNFRKFRYEGTLPYPHVIFTMAVSHYNSFLAFHNRPKIRR